MSPVVRPLPRPCKHRDCPNLVRGKSSYCPVHASEDTYNRPSTTERGYGWKWRQISQRIIRRDGGVCQIGLPGCTGVADTADHIVPKVQGGSDDDANLRAACRHCNGRRTGGLRSGSPATQVEPKPPDDGERFSIG